MAVHGRIYVGTIDIDYVMRSDILVGNSPQDNMSTSTFYNKVTVRGWRVRPREAHRICRIKGKYLQLGSFSGGEIHGISMIKRNTSWVDILPINIGGIK